MTGTTARKIRQTQGSLTVVGSGICAIAHITREAERAIKRADRVLYLVAEPVTVRWIESANSNASSLVGFYRRGEPLAECYRQIIDEILGAVRSGGHVCVVFYGHPGVFAYSSHESIRRAREEGFEARMLPGISAEDCLFADLGVDPGEEGCQSFESTDFLIHDRSNDPSSGLILWQVGTLAFDIVQKNRSTPRALLQILSERLAEQYPGDHQLAIYEAAQFSVAKPVIRWVQLEDLAKTNVPGLSTLYIPAAALPRENSEMAKRLKTAVTKIPGAT